MAGFLTNSERERLSTYPPDIPGRDLGRFFTLTAKDMAEVGRQRGDHNRLGFTLQLCTLRYLGFIPENLLEPPAAILKLLAGQLAVPPSALMAYGGREQTRSDHLAQALHYLGYRRATPLDFLNLELWLTERALEHDRPTFLLHAALERLLWERIVRPGLTRLERLVMGARQRAREATYARMRPLLTPACRTFLDSLLTPEEVGERTLLNWLQRAPNDNTATQIATTLDKIRFLQNAGVVTWGLEDVNPNRLKMLSNLGARATNQQLQRSSDDRRYAVLVAFLKQTLTDFTDITIDLVDACLWSLHADARRELDELRLRAARSTNEKLRTLRDVGHILLDPDIPEAGVRKAVFHFIESERLARVVEEAESLIRPDNDQVVDLLAKRYPYIRRFAPKLLATLSFHSHRQADPLLAAIEVLRTLDATGQREVFKGASTAFIPDTWWPYVVSGDRLNRRYYELATLWSLRLALRSGDIFVAHARRYADPASYLIPADVWSEQRREVVRLTSSSEGATQLKEREETLRLLARRVEALLSKNPEKLRVEKAKLVLTALEGEGRPERVDALEDALAARLPLLDLPDLLIEVDGWTGFSQHFRHASGGMPCEAADELRHLYASLLAQGCNFSLAQMSRTSGLAHHHLVYASTWFVREETLRAANIALVNYHHALSASRLWGAGTLSSSDGQRFPLTGKNRQARSIPRYFGYRRGVTFYTWTSDQFSQYGSKAISSTIRDATYVLDEILANETELPILEHTTDTSGYTEIVFALFDLLGLTFTPRIKDLADQQLYFTEALDLSELPKLRAHFTRRLDTGRVLTMWDELLRLAGSLKLGYVTASLVIQKLQAAPRKGELARALQEYGRLIKTLHILGWYEDEEMRRRAHRQLNKGEAVHDLRAYLSIGNRGVLRRKTDEGLQHQAGCLNLLTNAVILWNSVYMAEALTQLKKEGLDFNEEDLKHIWPTRFEHLNVYGKYDFDLSAAKARRGLRKLRDPNTSMA